MKLTETTATPIARCKSKRLTLACLAFIALASVPIAEWGQIVAGSDGDDGAFDPTTNTNVGMADHPRPL